MTQINQVGGWSVPGGDVTVRNYGGSDIPDGTIVLWDPANPGSFMTAPGVTVTTSGGSQTQVAGITIGVIPANSAGTIRRLGCAPATADGAVSHGDYIECSNTASKMGYGKTLATNDAAFATKKMGQAYGSASDGDQFMVILAI